MEYSVTFNLTESPESCPVSNSSLFKVTCQLVAYSALFALSIFGNTFLIHAFIKRHLMRNAMNYYIVNMASADLLTTLFDMSFQIWHYFLMMINKEFEWFDGLMGVLLCKLFVFIQGVAIACSVFSLLAIAIDRFMAVLFPLRRARSNRSIASVILGIWFVSFAVASPMLYAMRVKEHSGALFCLENWEPLFEDGAAKRNYTFLMFGALYVLPLFIIVALYSLIACKVWVRVVPGNVTPSNQLHENETRKRVLKICMTVVLLFALCWLPFYVYLMLMFLGNAPGECYPPEYVAFLGLLFGHANSAINPFIYFTNNSEYLRGVKQAFQRCTSPCKSNKIRMRNNRSVLISYPSLRTFRELELDVL